MAINGLKTYCGPATGHVLMFLQLYLILFKIRSFPSSYINHLNIWLERFDTAHTEIFSKDRLWRCIFFFLKINWSLTMYYMHTNMCNVYIYICYIYINICIYIYTNVYIHIYKCYIYHHAYIRMGWGTFVEDTFVECTFVEGTLVEWNIGRMEHW